MAWAPLVLAQILFPVLGTRDICAGRLLRSGISSSRSGISSSRFRPGAKFAPPVLSHVVRGLVHAVAKLRHILIALDLHLQPLGDDLECLEDLRVGPRISPKHSLRSA